MVDKMLEKQPENRVTAEELIAWVEQLLPNEDKSKIKLDLSPNPPQFIEESKEEQKMEPLTGEVYLNG